jgi:putative transposase
MRRVAAAFDVSRSALRQAVLRTTGAPASTTPTAERPGEPDSVLLARIQAVVDERPSYGYRFVTAMLNSAATSEDRVNHKRVYRVMRQHGLLLARHTGRPALRHDGKVRTLKSNLRWCTDAFEIHCFNGEKVHVVFSLDCCDREVMAFRASTLHPTGETIRDLMAETVEQRFGSGVTSTPHPVEWLSDNGPPFVANETRRFGEQVGLIVVNTPAYSPESNGMAEAFVKTFKRDYVYLKRNPDAATVLGRLQASFDDYNNVRPHSALGMRSPRSFRTQRLAA